MPRSSGRMKSGMGSPTRGALWPTSLASSRAIMRSTTAVNSGLRRLISSANAFSRWLSVLSAIRLSSVVCSRIWAKVFSAMVGFLEGSSGGDD